MRSAAGERGRNGQRRATKVETSRISAARAQASAKRAKLVVFVSIQFARVKER